MKILSPFNIQNSTFKIQIPLLHLPCAAAILALAACAAAPPHTPAEAHRELAGRTRACPRLAVLFVGNSYSFGVPKAFAKLAAARGKPVLVAQQTHSGWTLARHAASPETLAAIRSQPWDVIVFQEQSRLPSLPVRRALAMFPNVRSLAARARSHGAIPVLYQTWASRNGDPLRPADDFHAMTHRLRQGYHAASRHAGGLLVVPVGDAWQRRFSAGRARNLFMPDGSHPSPQGDALTAEVFYQTLFPPP